MKNYIEILEDGEVFLLKEDKLAEEMKSADMGYVTIIDISNPEEPKIYLEGHWLIIDEAKW